MNYITVKQAAQDTCLAAQDKFKAILNYFRLDM